MAGKGYKTISWRGYKAFQCTVDGHEHQVLLDEDEMIRYVEYAIPGVASPMASTEEPTGGK